MVTLGSIRLTLRSFKWLVKWLRERKKRNGATPQGQEKREQPLRAPPGEIEEWRRAVT